MENKSFLMRNKKGSHVGVIISFVIFIMFLTLMYIIVSPGLDTQRKEELIFEFLRQNVVKDVSDNLFSISVNLENSISESCIELDDFLNDFDINKNIFVRNGDNVLTFAAFTAANNLQINRIDNTDDFFKIYNSNSFEGAGAGSGSCSQLTEGGDYSFGLAQNDSYVFEKKIFDLMARYENYDLLKEDFNIPEGSDFGFGLVYNNGSVFETGFRDVSKSIYVKEFQIQYVNLEGKISSGFLKLMVW